jgi:hypothetical protein
MTPLMIEYLLAAIHTVGESTEQQVDAVVLREKVGYSLAEDRDAQRGLEHRGYITTKGADGVPKGFFWITEAGLRAAAEEREHGWSWPPTHF